MTKEQWSALLSLIAATAVVVASFWQWVTVTMDGGMPLRRWAKWMLFAVLALLLAALILFLASL